ncbi:hypothetical protein D3C87_2046890 [compost metagenome]
MKQNDVAVPMAVKCCGDFLSIFKAVIFLSEVIRSCKAILNSVFRRDSSNKSGALFFILSDTLYIVLMIF